MDDDSHDHAAIDALRLALVWDLCVAVIETAIGLAFGLVSLIAEGLHTLVDAAGSVLAWAWVKKARRPADRGHPYGHGMYETLAAFIEGAFIAAIGAGTILRGLAMLRSGDDPSLPEPWTMGLMIVVAIVYWLVSRHLLAVGAAHRSPAVVAEGWHLRTHIYLTGGIAVGFVAAKQWNWTWMDPVLAIVIGVLLAKISWQILRDAYRQFTGVGIAQGDLDEIAECLLQCREDFIEIHALHGRQAGPCLLLDLHLVLPHDMTVTASHAIAHKLETHVQRQYPNCRLTIHVEPGSAGDANRSGRVVIPSKTPFEREPSHHSDPRAHRG